MARVILNIEAESASDLQEAINDLATGGVQRHAGAVPPQPEPEPAAEQPQAEEQPKKRKRRTKAEIEADKKAHDAKQAEKAAAESDTNVVNLQPASEPQPEPEAPENPTREDVSAAMRALLTENGGAQMLELLKELGAVDDSGQAKISALDESKYVEAIQKAQELTAKLKAGAEQSAGLLE